MGFYILNPQPPRLAACPAVCNVFTLTPTLTSTEPHIVLTKALGPCKKLATVCDSQWSSPGIHRQNKQNQSDLCYKRGLHVVSH